MGEHHFDAVGVHHEFAGGCEVAHHEYYAEEVPREAHCGKHVDLHEQYCVGGGPHEHAVGGHHAAYDEGVHHELLGDPRNSGAANLEVRRAYEEDDELGCYDGVGHHHELLGDPRDSGAANLEVRRAYEEDDELGCYDGVGHHHELLGDPCDSGAANLEVRRAYEDDELGCYDGVGHHHEIVKVGEDHRGVAEVVAHEMGGHHVDLGDPEFPEASLEHHELAVVDVVEARG